MNISIELPDEVFSGFRCTPNDLANKIRLASASFYSSTQESPRHRDRSEMRPFASGFTILECPNSYGDRYNYDCDCYNI